MNFLLNLPTAEWILSTAAQSTAFVASCWIIFKFFKRRPAPLRSAMVTVCLLFLAVLPLFNLSPLSLAPKSFGLRLSIPLKTTSNKVPTASISPQPQTSDIAPENASLLHGTISGRSGRVLTATFWITLINLFGLFWISLFLIFLVRFSLGILSFQRLKRGLSEADYPQIDHILAEAQSVFPKRVEAKIFMSSQIHSPMAAGLFKPFILIPSASIKKMNRHEMRNVLIHELSHIYHKDHFIGLFQRLILLFNWWNPFVHDLSAALSRAREEVSDNHVLLRSDSREYARSLLGLVEHNTFLKRHPVSMAMASAHIPLQERVKLILSKERNMETHLKKTSFVLILAAAFFFLTFISGFRMTFAGIARGEDTLQKSFDVEPRAQEQSSAQENESQKTDPVRATGKIQAPKLIKKVDPVYPEEARKAGISGIVILEVTTDRYGKVQEPKILRSVPALDEAAIEAVKQWVYEPMIIDGKPFGIVFTVTCTFRLSDVETSAGVLGGVIGGVQGGVVRGVAGGVQGKGIGGVLGGVVGGVQGGVGSESDVPLTISGIFSGPKLIKKIEPIYPEEARKAGISGIVILEVTANKYGLVQEVKVLRSIPALDEAAIEAVRQWIYQPYIIDGKPREIKFTVTVKFNQK